MFLGKIMTKTLVKQKVIGGAVKEKGKGSYIGALTYTEIIKHMYDDYYCWNDDINPSAALKVLRVIFETKLRKTVPDSDIIHSIRVASQK